MRCVFSPALYILLDVKLAVKCGSTVGKFFETDTGGPQGDSSSAINFTFYLPKVLDQDQPATSSQPEEMDDITLSYNMQTTSTKYPQIKKILNKLYKNFHINWLKEAS